MVMSRSERGPVPPPRPRARFSLKWIVIAGVVALLVALGLIVADQYFMHGGEKSASAPAGTPAATAPASGTSGPVRTETIAYDLWTVTCQIPANQKRTCSATMKVTEKSNGQTVFAWIIGRDNQGVLRTVMQLPTGVLIQNGVDLKLGSLQPRKLGYTICDRLHCETAAIVDDALLKDLLATGEAVVTIVATNGQGINFNLPLKGIDKVIGSMSGS